MKATVIGFGIEGFLTQIGLRFENGLEIVTRSNMAWQTAKQKEEVEKNFREVVARLMEAGFEIDAARIDEFFKT